MGRKPTVGIDGIKEAALAVFMEKGYDGASMRDIARQAGCSVGLAYNYFRTKDEVFAGAMESFFAKYEQDFETIVQEGSRNPFQTMSKFFFYMEKETERFRENLGDKLHWTVRWAIRERTLTVIEPYIGRIIEILMGWGAVPPLSLKVTAELLAHGIGGMILHIEQADYRQNREDCVRGANLLMGLSPEEAGLMLPFFAEKEDEAGCRALLPWALHAEKFAERAAADEILVIRKAGEVVGMLVFSRGKREIQGLSVKEAYRRRGIGLRLLVTALSTLPVGEEVSVMLPENSGEADEAELFFRKMGFADRVARDGYAAREHGTVREGQAVRRLIRTVPETADEFMPKKFEHSEASSECPLYP